MKFKILENETIKSCRSECYNYIFNKVDGKFVRWGRTKEDDPPFSPIGPEILDWEVSTICTLGCKACYKSNTSNGKNLNFNKFKIAFSKIPRSVCQIAYGVGTLSAHPEIFKILNYTREHGVIPNITINGKVSDSDLERLSKVCGAVAVSHYDDDACYDTVYKLTEFAKQSNATLRQVNIHQLMASEEYDKCLKTIDDVSQDRRLVGLNATVFLSMKPIGDRNNLTSITYEQFTNIISYGQKKKITIGMDSCSAPMMIKYIDEKGQLDVLSSIEPCESFGLFSSYLNVDCDYFPCSFAEGHGEWKNGISILDCEDFIKDIWFNKKLNKWRKISLEMTSKCNCEMSKYCRVCPIFDITPCFRK